MVATILKKVTTKGIEAATAGTGTGVGTGSTNSPSSKGGSNVTFSSSTTSGSPSASSMSPFFVEKENNNENENKLNPQCKEEIIGKNSAVAASSSTSTPADGLYGIISKYASDAYISTRDTINTASDETTKRISHLASSILSNNDNDGNGNGNGNVNMIQGQFGENGAKLGTGISTDNDQSSGAGVSASTPRKWFMTNDPYNTVSGRNLNLIPPTQHRKSVMAVRELLELVDIGECEDDDDETDEYRYHHDGGGGQKSGFRGWGSSFWEKKPSLARIGGVGVGGGGVADAHSSVSSFASDDLILDELSHSGGVPNVSSYSSGLAEFSGPGSRPGQGQGQHPSSTHNKPKRSISKAETASRLSEGTVRAMRDMALNEALELHHALRFWTARLERPFLYYMESGPRLWISNDKSDDKYHTHADVGQKVSQLQAVLARRCSSIGLLQQHLWRAGWSSGVEQWGILGQGEWAAVVGGHGLIDDRQGMMISGLDDHRSSLSRKGGRGKKGGKKDYYSESHLFVKNVRGGQIVRNDPALAAWSIDAIRVVRDQLYMAGSGHRPLPKYEHWPREQRHFEHNLGKDKARLWDSMVGIDGGSFENDEDTLDIPLWATCDVEREARYPLVIPESRDAQELQQELEDFLPVESDDSQQDSFLPSKSLQKQVGDIAISDLSLMATEVAEILDIMETYMEQQRRRRLDKLKPPSRIMRNWYVAAFGIPIAGYVAYKLMKENRGLQLAKYFYQNTVSFCAEHISEPLQSIYRELFTGRVNVTDHKAREDVITILQKMIKSWLDEVYPDMPESERADKALKMDMSLIESTKEYSIKNILEISNIYRLSLIEMQFIKKEMMNALVAIDELMGSNEINMQLAAMTPAFLVASSIRHIFGKLYYALLKLGKSKQETYASFRHIILDIERLLVMRDDPPPSIPPLATGVNSLRSELDQSGSEENDSYRSRSTETLSSDDLGMLMLLVHDCRVILWRDRRRFSRTELRNASEDLAELAGERGAVSIRQQLKIISRMCRTYSFLKAEIPFSIDA